MRRRASIALGCGLALLAGACRSTWRPSEAVELEGAALLGWRQQAGEWENGDVPVEHLDFAARPAAWPVGVELAFDLSGFAGDQTGEQTVGLGVGLVRGFELVPQRLWARLGIGREFLATDNGELFASESDSWQATYLTGGLYTRVGSDVERPMRLGLEARYASGPGPEFSTQALDGEFLDLYLVLAWGP